MLTSRWSSPQSVSPSPRARRRHEAAALVLAGLVVTVLAGPPAHGVEGDAPGEAGWTSPVPGDLVVLRGFLPPDQDWLAGHRGVDLEAPPGSAVVAPEDGVVTFAGTVVDRGVLVVLHDGGLRSSLEPVDGSVAVGTRVGRGQVVGTVQVADDGTGSSAGAGPAGAGHCRPVSCLHWGVRRGDTYVDPLALLGPREPIVLLPLR
ncbi:murein hydrolase activator EnvC [Oerskovia sp. KBS0722]|uniref:murein hydrolase activator EnvC family protein n=1 Tax=Oerskovia sp. KBS0722 TaxID=1179673 RepID=UPI001FEDE1F1|nr:M23 family metallopeptidase [Oerskovia sp. KBS0722]